jgi:hypothetical protein
MIGPLFKAIYWTLGGVQALLEVVGITRSLVKEARKGTLPHKLDDTDPIPLSRPKPPPTLRSVVKK